MIKVERPLRIVLCIEFDYKEFERCFLFSFFLLENNGLTFGMPKRDPTNDPTNDQYIGSCRATSVGPYEF